MDDRFFDEIRSTLSKMDLVDFSVSESQSGILNSQVETTGRGKTAGYLWFEDFAHLMPHRKSSISSVTLSSLSMSLN
uniref:Uncharacterized protein n=1 Tax=Romanomermis culicivorax TaxID=13658 RepID=A0A915HIA2_ROMCU